MVAVMFSQVSLPEDFKETEIGPIPVDWEVIQISDVADIKGGGTPSTKKPHFWNGAIPFLTPSDVTSHRTLHISRSSRYITEEGLKQSSAKLMPRGSVLMTSRATIGEVAICDVPMATNQGFINIIVRPDELANEFLAYWITWRKEFLKELGTGTTFKEVSKGVFKTVRIPLPPLPEQRRIAHVLSTIQRAIAAQDDLIAAAREVKRSLMQRLFTYGPDAEPAPTKETEIGEIPEHWEVVRLGELCQLDRENLEPQELPEMPYVGLEHIESGEPKLRKWGSSNEVRSSKHHFVPRDVLYGKLRPYLDKAVLAEFEGVCSTDILVVKANAEFTLPEFLVHLLHTQQFLSYAISTTSGTNLPRTRWTSLRDFKLALPSLPEQRRIASILQAADRKIEVEEQRKAVLQALFKSMLHQLMTGQVRV